ncbi:MAG: hypothetical protein OHK0022_30650 [Roseiflexaceae bacterium]
MAGLFSNVTALAALAAQLRALIATSRSSGALRAWVAGCATGEDAYACAMLLHEATTHVGGTWSIKVFATEANPQLLAAARAGLYPSAQLGLIPRGQREQYWFAISDYAQAKEFIRASIVFAAHRLLRDPPFANLDLVICRESFVALEQLGRATAIDHFAFALRPGGLLLLGTELPVEHSHFATRDPAHLLYIRRQPPAFLPDTPAPEERVEPRVRPHSAAPAPAVEQPALLIDRQSVILHLYPGAEQFLRIRSGAPSYRLFELIHPLLRDQLRETLDRALARQRPAESAPVWLRLGQAGLMVTIVVQPLPDEDQVGGQLLVLFDATEQATAQPALLPVRPLLPWDERLQLVAQHDVAIQELRTANEELRITNEELMVANEELDVRREELDTLNSELLRINNELNRTVEEISRINADLQNLIAAIDIGTLFLDRSLRVRRYTPQIEELFNLIPTDLDRPLAHLTHRLHYDLLIDDLHQLLALLAPIEREVQHVDGRWFLVRLRPYRTIEDRIDGVVLTFLDISERRLVAEALRSSEQQLRQSHEELERRVQERTAALLEAQVRLQQLVGAVVRAQEDERQRVARELHDTLGQFLTALTLRLTLLQQTPGIMPAVRTGLAELHRVAGQIDAELDRMTMELRPPALDDLGLEDALHDYTREWAGASGVAIDVLARGLDNGRLPPAVETTVYRIVQEALTNVLKHAQASRVSVILERRDDRLRAIVEDNGRGFDPDALSGQGKNGRQMGLLGMAERATLAGGELSVESAPGSGTTIYVDIPLA